MIFIKYQEWARTRADYLSSLNQIKKCSCGSEFLIEQQENLEGTPCLFCLGIGYVDINNNMPADLSFRRYLFTCINAFVKTRTDDPESEAFKKSNPKLYRLYKAIDSQIPLLDLYLLYNSLCTDIGR